MKKMSVDDENKYR